jgi:membrane protein DedA with SNARE-associated domain
MTHFLASHTYLAIFILSLISSLGIPVGAELAIIFGGALASGQVTKYGHIHLSIVAVILVATAGELGGSLGGYAVGKYGGRALVDKLGKYILLTNKDLDRAEAWFAHHGDPLALFGRFIPLLRSFVSLAAGLAEMRVSKFSLYTVIGCGLWVTALAALGDSVGKTYNTVLKDFTDAGYIFGVVAVIVVAAFLLHRIRAVRAERASTSQ